MSKTINNQMNSESQMLGTVIDNQMPDYSEMSADEIAEKIRESRKSLVLKNALKAEGRPGFVRRVVTDKPGRIEEFLRKGWAPVKGKDEFLEDGRVQSGTQLGTVSKKVVNPSNGSKLSEYGILMEIPESIYKEDQRKKHLEQLEIEKQFNPEAMKKAGGNNATDGLYGSGVQIARD